MSIKIVMGPAAAGKSYFIKENFPDSTVIDLWDFQKDQKFVSVELIMESYLKTRDALVEAIKEGKDVVLEHTLLKAIRREMYVNAIREVTNEPIDIYVLKPSKETYKAFNKKRKLFCDDRYADEMFEILEIPTKEEGFNNIYIIEPKEKLEI